MPLKYDQDGNLIDETDQQTQQTQDGQPTQDDGTKGTTRYSNTTTNPDNSYTTKVTTEPVDSTRGPDDTTAAADGATAESAVKDLQAKTAPATYKVGAPDQKVASDVADFIKTKGLKANQSDPVGSMGPIVEYLRSKGINAQVDYTDVNGHSGGILVDGKPYQLIDGQNNWTPLQEWAQDTQPTTAKAATNTTNTLDQTLANDWYTSPSMDAGWHKNFQVEQQPEHTLPGFLASLYQDRKKI